MDNRQRHQDSVENPEDNFQGFGRTAFSYTMSLLLVAALFLSWSAWERTKNTSTQEQQLVSQAGKGTVAAIQQRFVELRRSVQLFAEREIPLLQRLAKDPEDIDTYDTLVERSKQVFGDAFAVTLADSHGTPHIEDFDGYIVEVCRRDITSFAELHIPPEIVIHPNPFTYHIDVMVEVEFSDNQKEIFFISFTPTFVSNILSNSSLYGHRFVLVNRNREGLVEITAEGTRQELPEEAFFLTEQEKNNIKYRADIPGTAWTLVDIEDPVLITDQYINTILEVSIILFVLFVFSIVTLRRLRGAESHILKQNDTLKIQAKALTNSRTQIEKERAEVVGLLEGMTDAYLVVDNNFRLLKMNSEAEKIFGVSRDVVYRNNLWDTLPGLIDTFQRQVEYAKESGEIAELEGLYTTTSLWLKLTIYPSDQYLSLFFRDITERREREIAVQNSEKRLRAILDTAVDAIITVDEQGNICSANRAAELMFGYTLSEFISMNVSSLLSDPSALKNESTNSDPLANNLKQTLGMVLEGEGRRKKGEYFPVELSTGEMHLGDEHYFATIIRDITQRKRMEEDAKQALIDKVEAESASKSKSAFLANMSHEIRTPLTAIIGFAEMLLEHDHSEQERIKTTNTIIRSGRHLMNIINQILDLSKIEAEKLELENVEVSPFQVLHDVSSLSAMFAEEKGLDFKIIVKNPLPNIVLSDPIRMKQILINLVSNAIKFTEKGHVYLYADCNKDKQQLIFTIEDTGIGLSEEQLEQIFMPFTQADTSTTRKYGGTGLGLTLSLQLARLMSGDINVTQSESGGSCFTVAISVGIMTNSQFVLEEDEDMEKSNTNSKTQPSSTNGRVLIAEDTLDLQKLISLYVRKTGAEVVVVGNGKEAVDAVSQGNFDLILMDMQMPIMDGLTAVKTLRSQGVEIPIVALTANAMKQDQESYDAAGCNGFLAKPVDRKLLHDTVIQYIEKTNSSKIATDIQAELENAGLDNVEVEELLNYFVSRLPGFVEKISQAYSAKEWDIVHRESHSLKGSAGSYGYSQISELAAEIEQSIKNKSYDKLQEKIDALARLCENIHIERRYKGNNRASR